MPDVQDMRERTPGLSVAISGPTFRLTGARPEDAFRGPVCSGRSAVRRFGDDFLAVVGRRENYEEAARSGLDVLTDMTYQSIERLTANAARYRATHERHGLAPKTGRVAVMPSTCLGSGLTPTRAEALGPFSRRRRASLSLAGQVADGLGLGADVSKACIHDLDHLLRRAHQRYCDEAALIALASRAALVDVLAEASAGELTALVGFGVTRGRRPTGRTCPDALCRRYHEAGDTAGDGDASVRPHGSPTASGRTATPRPRTASPPRLRAPEQTCPARAPRLTRFPRPARTRATRPRLRLPATTPPPVTCPETHRTPVARRRTSA
ncbi:hypothetical protein [Streptomyces sp. NPDC101455]|uniref:hypothetical protein n=1 Tax=Streptomyces sp. NPDC101455 TaxID=3366142 RepID=UPI0037F2B4A3